MFCADRTAIRKPVSRWFLRTFFRLPLTEEPALKEITPREKAKQSGSIRYFTGKPCLRGHISERQVSDKSCCECKRIRIKKLRESPEFREEERAEERRRWASNIERRNKKAEADKRRRKTDEYRTAQNKKDREKYRSDASHRASKIKRACAFFQENKEKIAERKREWFFRKYRSDDGFKTKHLLRSMVSRACNLAKIKKLSSSFDYLGYSVSDFRIHIEKQFLDGMTWDNHGQWHIDHITPISVMIRSGETRPQAINCLSNLRPIWKEDNFSKSDNVEFLI